MRALKHPPSFGWSLGQDGVLPVPTLLSLVSNVGTTFLSQSQENKTACRNPNSPKPNDEPKFETKSVHTALISVTLNKRKHCPHLSHAQQEKAPHHSRICLLLMGPLVGRPATVQPHFRDHSYIPFEQQHYGYSQGQLADLPIIRAHIRYRQRHSTSEKQSSDPTLGSLLVLYELNRIRYSY